MLRANNISLIIWVSMLFTFGFTIMHAVFILYTEMGPANGGLGFSEADNGRVFAMIGITGIVTQGFLIGPFHGGLVHGASYLWPVQSPALVWYWCLIRKLKAHGLTYWLSPFSSQ